MKNAMQTTLKTTELKSPLMTASGTSGHADEIEILARSGQILESLGAFVTKGVTLEPKEGNTEFRIAETRTGILNSIGLQNEGVQYFMQEEVHHLLNFSLPVYVNISADSVEGFGRLAAYLSDHDAARIISGLEINVSCPNIKKGGAAFGTDPELVETIVRTVKQRIDPRIQIITKLTPNVADITVTAMAAIRGGTDILSMINTLRGMAIDVNTQKPLLGNVVGGLSGPAIKPVGLFMVYDCFRRIPECRSGQVPIIGIGGISRWQDVVEYLLAGATAVGIGTAWFVNPDVFKEIHQGLKAYLVRRNTTVVELIGGAHA